MRITKQQAIILHNNAVSIREKTKEIELFVESLPEEEQNTIKKNLKEIYELLNKQQAIVSYFLNGFPVNASLKQNKTPESWESALIDELEISTASICLLKRNNIFSINALISFLQNQSLSDLRGCGPVKAELIEEALERYLEKKQNKEERRGDNA